MEIEAIERELRKAMKNAAQAIRISDECMKRALKLLKEAEKKRPTLRVVK